MMEKKHDYAIDLLKFVAVLMITNSHFLPLYQDVKPGLATFGVHGNAIFFFVSGLTLTMSGSVKKLNFFDWYKRRISRILPALIMWSVMCSMFLGEEISWKNLTIGYPYWFLTFIMCAYVAMYFIIRYASKYLNTVLALAVLGTLTAIAVLPKTSQSVYHEFHWFCYSSCLILGALVGANDKTANLRLGGGVKFIVSFILYFVIMAFGKGRSDAWYYVQLLALFPLLFFLYYGYFVSKSICDKVVNNRWLFRPISWVGGLCLEIYMVQHVIITDRFNNVFPLNIVMVFAGIVMLAYTLHVLTNWFVQTLSKEQYNWQKILKI